MKRVTLAAVLLLALPSTAAADCIRIDKPTMQLTQSNKLTTQTAYKFHGTFDRHIHVRGLLIRRGRVELRNYYSYKANSDVIVGAYDLPLSWKRETVVFKLRIKACGKWYTRAISLTTTPKPRRKL